MYRAALQLAVVSALAACAERGAGSAAASDLLGEWELTEGTAVGAPLPLAVGRPATLVLEDRQLGGMSFCNHYSGGYRLDGEALEIDGLGGTERGCEPDVMAAEGAHLAALDAVGERGSRARTWSSPGTAPRCASAVCRRCLRAS